MFAVKAGIPGPEWDGVVIVEDRHLKLILTQFGEAVAAVGDDRLRNAAISDYLAGRIGYGDMLRKSESPKEVMDILLDRARKSRETVLSAEALTERLLGGAPRHLIGPQIEELSGLAGEQLAALNGIVQFPLADDMRKRILDVFEGDAAVLNRMEKRYETARAIIQADRQGLYELAEHRSAMGEGLDDNGNTVTMTKLRRHFHIIVNQVAEGREFTVTVRGKPTVRIIPYRGEGGFKHE